MDWGDYIRIALSRKYHDTIHMHEYRNILAGLLHKKPRELYELPGDWAHLANSPVNSDEHSEYLKQRIKKLGLSELMKMGEC